MIGEKWVARFKDGDGKNNMGITDHYLGLPKLIEHIFHLGGSNIVITDETCRAGIIEGEIINEHSSDLHTRTT
jgi:hypothetical protein